MYFRDQPGPHPLAQEESTHQEHVGIPYKPYSTEYPEGNDKRDRYMDGQDPLARKLPDIGSPIPERYVQEKYE